MCCGAGGGALHGEGEEREWLCLSTVDTEMLLNIYLNGMGLLLKASENHCLKFYL